MDMQLWLETFKRAWAAHDTNAVLALFAKDVEYWETPFKKFESFDALATEWQGISAQSDIEISAEVFASEGANHSVAWRLKYQDHAGVRHTWAGTYLIRLDSTNRCSHFYQTGEQQPAA